MPSILKMASALVTALLSWVIIATQHLHGVHSHDTDHGPQKFHTVLTPRIGGISIFFVSCGNALVVKSKSFPSLPKIASRTGPPTSANVKPLALNDCARELANGARSIREAMAKSTAGCALTISKVRAVPLLHDPGTWCGQRRY